MKQMIKYLVWVCMAAAAPTGFGQVTPSVVDLPTRAGVTQRMLVLTPPSPKAAVILFTGGDGSVQIQPDGSLKDGNFLVRTRQFYAERGLLTVVVDSPSDRQSPPFLAGFRQTPEHVADIKASIAWLRARTAVPVWLIGTSRGTQSVAYAATQLVAGDGPDGIVLTSTILTDKKSRAVPDMELSRLRLPVLVVHHEQDGCVLCAFDQTGRLMDRLTASAHKKLISVNGGVSKGDPCEARAYHGYNGIERQVVDQIVDWILDK